MQIVVNHSEESANLSHIYWGLHFLDGSDFVRVWVDSSGIHTVSILIELGEVYTDSDFAIGFGDNYHSCTPLAWFFNLHDHPQLLHSFKFLSHRLEKRDGYLQGVDWRMA